MKRFELENWQKVIAIVMLLVGGGGAAYAKMATYATVDDVDKAQTSAAAQLGAVQAATATQLGALQAQVQDLRVKQATVDAKLDVLVELSTRLLDQSRSIARATGARQVPAAPPVDPSHPP